VLDRAKGILQRDMGISEDQAYRTMQRESRQRRKSMREIADAILLGDDLKKVHGDGDQTGDAKGVSGAGQGE
jgi:uroporphyrinogen-III synthase